MPFNFRKLKHVLRLLPSTEKSLSCIKFSYSTGVKEYNSGQDSSNTPFSVTNPSSNQLISLANNSIVLIKDTTDDSLILFREASKDIFNPFITISVPASFSQDLTQKKICELALRKRSRRSSLSAIENDLTTSSKVSPNIFKPVSVTTDDILTPPSHQDPQLSFCDGIHANFFSVSASQLQSLQDEIFSHFCSYNTDEKTHSQNIFDTPDSCAGNHSDKVLLFSSTESRHSEKKNGPTPEQLHQAREKCITLVEKMLVEGNTDQSILHPNVILENNLYGRNKMCKGLTAYYLELLKLRIMIHIRTSGAKMTVLNITQVEQTGMIRIHWRLTGISQLNAVKFWRLKDGDLIKEEDREWLEAFSYFYIGDDGLVHKHRIDRTIPDEGAEPNKLKEKIQNMLNPAKPLVS